MDYISTKEAAKKWLVSIRCVQGFLTEGRIPGATKLGRSWAIPSDAKKPADLRNREDTERSAGEYPHVPHLYCYLPLPRGNADLAGQSLKNETERTMLRAELAKLRGDFATAERLCRQIPAGSPIKVCASALLAECAIDTGNYPQYVKANGYLMGAHGGGEESAAQTALLSIRMSMLISGEEHKLTSESFAQLPVEVRPLIVYLHLKNLQSELEFSRMVDVSEAALALILRKDTYTVLEVYIFLLCAVGHFGLKEKEEARRYISRAMDIALPDGIIMPFVEFLADCGGFIEQCVEEKFPEYSKLILDKWNEVWENWISFRNSYINGAQMAILPLRECQIAMFIANGATYDETASHFGLSLGRIRNLTSSIYGKLNVSSRSELRELMLHGQSSKLKNLTLSVISAFES